MGCSKSTVHLIFSDVGGTMKSMMAVKQCLSPWFSGGGDETTETGKK